MTEREIEDVFELLIDFPTEGDDTELVGGKYIDEACANNRKILKTFSASIDNGGTSCEKRIGQLPNQL